uniref:Uncharacterized protein n=1 Tax=Cucumis melo TaxID=3656 RepID=A0A9I9E973_CUCME
MGSPQHGIKSSNIPHHDCGYLHTPKDPSIPLKAYNPVHNNNTSIKNSSFIPQGKTQENLLNQRTTTFVTNPLILKHTRKQSQIGKTANIPTYHPDPP